MRKKILMVLLASCLMVNLLPASVLAAGTEVDAQTEETALDGQAEEDAVDGQEENMPDVQEKDAVPDGQKEDAADADGDIGDQEAEIMVLNNTVKSGTCGENLTWSLDAEGTLSISGTGAVENYNDLWRGEGVHEVVIWPGVTSIGRSAFWDCDNLTSITIPDSVTSIGDFAFWSCDNLTSITIPDSVTSIGSSAFCGCGLTSITIPGSVTSIGDNAFLQCFGLTSITIPDSVTNIGKSVFNSCSSLTSITIPDSVTSIGDFAFDSCRGLTSITIPDSVTSIGDWAFSGCSSLTSITIPDSVTSIGEGAFGSCRGLTSITIPDSVTSIGNSTFLGCSGLTSITIPDSVTSIGDRAFYGCSSLTSITIPGSVTSIGNSTFFDCDNLTSITIPDSVTSIGNSTFFDCDNLTSITIPDSVTSIGDQAFYGCDGLTSIMIPGSVTSIGAFAFGSCWGLISITIPDSVTSIGEGAFASCRGLTSITIPDSVTSIGNRVFNRCSGLTSTTIPNSVTSIGNGAFYCCDELTDIYYSGGESDWKAITVGYENEPLSNATIHYNSGSDVPDDSENISKIKINGKSIQSLFSKSSLLYDDDLAHFAATLSKEAEDTTGDNIRNFYSSLEWPVEDREVYQYDGDRAYSIACAKLSKDENLLVITARGSQTLSELVEDGFSFGLRDFFGYVTNDVIYDFERDIMKGLNEFLNLDSHKYLMEKDLKVLITGHSLGGAAANLNAARFTMFEDSGAWWSDLTEQGDIYCYTFGAINSLSDNSPVKNGFENIHNIYNILDSFGPCRCGNWLPSGLGRGYGKFGHMEMYSHNYETSLYIPIVDSTNHLIENYIDSLDNGYVNCKKNEELTIHGGGGWCPVNLRIYLETTNGPVLVGSITDNQIDEVEHPMVGLRVEGDKKYFYFPDDGNYIIELEGTDIGTMTYFVQDMDAETGEPVDDTGIVYRQVQLVAGKQFYSDVKIKGDILSGIQTEKVPLYVLDKDGEPEKEVLPDGNGTEVNKGTEKFASYEGFDFYRDTAGNITCLDSTGAPVINEFKCDGIYTYYFQADGTAMKDRLTYHPDGVHVIYFDEEGHETFDSFALVGHNIPSMETGIATELNEYCYFNTFGYQYTDVVTYDVKGEKLYYANTGGVLERSGWFSFSGTVTYAGDGKPWSAAGQRGYANGDCTLMKDTFTYDENGNLCYMQGNGAVTYDF